MQLALGILVPYEYGQPRASAFSLSGMIRLLIAAGPDLRKGLLRAS